MTNPRRAKGGAGTPQGMGKGSAQGNPSGPSNANDPGSTRYGRRSGAGGNEPKDSETKQERGWTSRQGGDQTR